MRDVDQQPAHDAERRAKAAARQRRWRARKLAGARVLPVEIGEEYVARLPARLTEMGLLDPEVEPDAEQIAQALGMIVEAYLQKSEETHLQAAFQRGDTGREQPENET